MQVTGEEGVMTEDFVTHQKSLFLDMVYLQQDAFDKVDASVSIERQVLTFKWCITTTVEFKDKPAARSLFTELTGFIKNFHFAATDTPDYNTLLDEIDRKKKPLSLAEAS